jgi:hypothetical protein
MRTTLDIDDDVLAAAKELSRRQRRSAGAVISDLARRALTGAVDKQPADGDNFFGFRPLPRRSATVVTNEQIDKLRAEGEY